MGLPIIATDIRGCRQVVDHGVNGYLIPVGRPDLLRESIRELAAKPEVRAKMSDESRRIAVERFDEQDVVEAVLASYRDALAAKGLGHLMPGEMAGSSETIGVRKAAGADAASLANLHFDYMKDGFLPRLGRPFLRVLYRALIEWDGSETWVAADDSTVVGFVAAVRDVGLFYRRFLKRYGLAATLAALPRLLRPSNLRRAWETLTYGGGESQIPAEVLSMAVAPRAGGHGLSSDLLELVLQHLGGEAVRVVVGAENATAIRAYQRAGFVLTDRIEVHRGEPSDVMVWHR